MHNATLIDFLWLFLGAILEIAANIFLKYSQGFTRILYGIIALLCVLGAFAALSQAVKGIDLSVSYALWGALGIITTSIIGACLFKQHVNLRGWIGFSVLILGILLLKLS